MPTHSVRELKNNPSELFRELDEGKTPVLTRRGEPIGVAVPFSTVLEAGAETALAIHLLAQGAISLGTAARMARRSVEDLLDLLKDIGIEDVLYDEERLREDIETLSTL